MAKASTSVEEVGVYVTKIQEQLERLKKTIPVMVSKVKAAIKDLLDKLEGITYRFKIRVTTSRTIKILYCL